MPIRSGRGGGRGSRASVHRPVAPQPDSSVSPSRGKDPGPGSSPAPEQPEVPPEQKEYAQAKEILLRQLTASAKSRAQLEQKLMEKEISEETATRILDRYEDLGLVDDAAYAELFVRSRVQSRKLATSALRRELAQKGVTGDTAEQALAQRDEESEQADARRLVRQKIRPERDLVDREAKSKAMKRLAGMLARRGYPAGTAFPAIREELELAAEDIAEYPE